MTDLAPVLVDCKICRHPFVDAINRRIRDHGILPTIRWMTDNDLNPPHRNTFSTHKREHMTTEFERDRIDATKRMAAQQKMIKAKSGDLAELVRNNVFARVEEGTLEPSLSEGLRAQEMLDRRSEKQGDRDMMLQIAGLLSGATPPVALLGDPNVIEGEYREADDDVAEFAALLPGGV